MMSRSFALAWISLLCLTGATAFGKTTHPPTAAGINGGTHVQRPEVTPGKGPEAPPADQPGTVTEHPGPVADSRAAQVVSPTGTPKAASQAKPADTARAALTEARNHLENLRASLKEAEASGTTPEVLDRLRAKREQIELSLRRAKDSERDLHARTQQMPGVPTSDEFLALDSASTELKTVARELERKSASAQYWRDVGRVRADLERLESRIDLTLNRLKDFESKRGSSKG